LPSFQHLLVAVAQAWQERREELRAGAGQIVEQLARQTGPLPVAAIDEQVLAEAVRTLAAEADRERGGFGGAPKFPPSMTLEFLLRHHERTGSAEALSLVDECAEAMSRGGMYDQLAGGFARYSVDADWVVPHFEKMLYDNALLLRVYAHLARLTGSARALAVARATGGFLLGQLGTDEGGFAASLDADTLGEEGLTYVWTPGELREVLGADADWAAELFGVTESGTFEHGKSVLQLRQDPDDPARFERVRAALLAARDQRPQPGRDDKVLAAWNGLAITALCEAGVALNEPRWIEAADRAASAILDLHMVDGRLRRSSRHGEVGEAAGVLEDYALFADGLLALHQATGGTRWLDDAVKLLDTALERFAVEDTPGAYHDTADDAETLVQRPSDPADNASPSGASALAGALVTASVLVGPERAGGYREAAELALSRVGQLATKVPRFAGNWLSVAEALAAGPVQVAVVGLDPEAWSELRTTAAQLVHGGGVVLAGQPDSAPLLADRPLVEGAAAAYVCRGYVCDRPVTSADELEASLAR
jgi:uncharacterized protein YyaL (SSP411 family)